MKIVFLLIIVALCYSCQHQETYLDYALRAAGNSLVFDNVPKGALLWLHDYTRGWDERPFLIDDDGNVEWW